VDKHGAVVKRKRETDDSSDQAKINSQINPQTENKHNDMEDDSSSSDETEPLDDDDDEGKIRRHRGQAEEEYGHDNPFSDEDGLPRLSKKGKVVLERWREGRGREEQIDYVWKWLCANDSELTTYRSNDPLRDNFLDGDESNFDHGDEDDEEEEEDVGAHASAGVSRVRRMRHA